jgi:hypothetical protein
MGAAARCQTELQYFADNAKRAEELFATAIKIRKNSGWTDAASPRCAVGPANCAQKTGLAVRVVEDANRYKASLNTNPVAIALFERDGVGQLTEKYYNIRYQDTDAAYAFHVMVVLPNSTDVTSWEVWSVRKASNATYVANKASNGTFEVCPNNHGWVPVSTGNFDSCDGQRAKIDSVDGAFGFLNQGMAAQAALTLSDKHILSQIGMSAFGDVDAFWSRSPNGPAWVSCGLGCCSPRL